MKKQVVGECVSLAAAPGGTSGVIVSMDGDREFLSKASGRGLTPHAPLEVIQNYRIGPVIVFLRDSQIALSRVEARKITIEKRETNVA